MSALGNVIAALVTRQTSGTTRKHVPYRDSKLTRLLEDSLGGNCRTTMLATISPAAESIAETLSTLKFAMRAKRVTNVPRLNEDLDQASLLRKYERELRRLRAELEERNRNVVDQRCLLELEERHRRAEDDKRAARVVDDFSERLASVRDEAMDRDGLCEREDEHQDQDKPKVVHPDKLGDVEIGRASCRERV